MRRVLRLPVHHKDLRSVRGRRWGLGGDARRQARRKDETDEESNEPGSCQQRHCELDHMRHPDANASIALR